MKKSRTGFTRTAALLKEQGFGLIGVTMGLACSSNAADRGCCSFSAAADAKKISDQLGFPHYTLNFKDEFRHQVIDNFIAEYRMGRTPNPCIRCNQFLKFDLLLKKARELNADYIATGHYARVRRTAPSPSGRGALNDIVRQEDSRGEGLYKLLKGKDLKKDQSYVLYTMNQESLAHTLFPLGEWTKDKVREKARELKLPVAEKEESQEICFVEDDDYGRFIREAIPAAVQPGDIVDKAGNVVGRHDGIAFYTIGQRKGIAIGGTGPYYAAKIDYKTNILYVLNNCDDKLLYQDKLIAKNVNWTASVKPKLPLKCQAVIRYRHKPVKCLVTKILKNNYQFK